MEGAVQRDAHALLAAAHAELAGQLHLAGGVMFLHQSLQLLHDLRLLFRKFTGHSLGRYLRIRRLTQATALLRSSALNIKEIAERCGYDSIASFCRAYKRESGFTPQEVRKMISEHDN